MMKITALKSYPWRKRVFKAGENYDVEDRDGKILLAGKLAKAADEVVQKKIVEEKKSEEKKLETAAPNRASRRATAAVAPKNLTSENIVTAPNVVTTETTETHHASAEASAEAASKE